MNSVLIEIKYYETYYFASLIRNILNNQFKYLRNLDEFYGCDNYLVFIKPYEKYSVFHQFIDFIIKNVLYEEKEQIDLEARRRNEKKIFRPF